MDTHEPTATVREALQFSADLRQSREVSHESRIACVTVLMDLLDLRQLSDAVVGTPSAGLNLDQRKRLQVFGFHPLRPLLICLQDDWNRDSEQG